MKPLVLVLSVFMLVGQGMQMVGRAGKATAGVTNGKVAKGAVKGVKAVSKAGAKVVVTLAK